MMKTGKRTEAIWTAKPNAFGGCDLGPNDGIILRSEREDGAYVFRVLQGFQHLYTVRADENTSVTVLEAIWDAMLDQVFPKDAR